MPLGGNVPGIISVACGAAENIFVWKGCEIQSYPPAFGMQSEQHSGGCSKYEYLPLSQELGQN